MTNIVTMANLLMH